MELRDNLSILLVAGLLVGALLVGLLLIETRQAVVSPVRAIFVRWARWLAFAFGAAGLNHLVGLIDRPFWVLVPAFFLLWLLAETLRNWLAIEERSLSSAPLFPRFTVNESGEEWPTHPPLLRLRDWLRARGFKPVQALQAEVAPGLRLRSSFYQDATAAIRLQVLFLPQAGGALAVCFALSTQTASGRRYVTDNLCLPFGGFYPESWLVERSLWRRSLPSLVVRHQARLAQAGETAVAWIDDPLSDINAQQRELERINTELGFLFPPSEREEHGKITQAGRYRVWKECWLVSYFGRSARYR
ncbi:MAG: hypothetical protein WCL04_04390 [Verrucomicrobiota bacterium]